MKNIENYAYITTKKAVSSKIVYCKLIELITRNININRPFSLLNLKNVSSIDTDKTPSRIYKVYENLVTKLITTKTPMYKNSTFEKTLFLVYFVKNTFSVAVELFF